MKKKGIIQAVLAAALLSASGCSSSQSTASASTVSLADATLEADYPTMDVDNGIPDDATGRLADIKEAGVLTVATEPYWVPNEFIDPTKTGQDQYVGSDIELAKYIADKMGVELEIVPLEFSAVLAAIPEGKYDLAISALAYTPQRAEAMELSEGYYFSSDDAGYGLLVSEELASSISGPDDLADYTVITQSGSLQELIANEQIPACKELKLVSSMNDAYIAVQEGKADAAVVARASAQLYIDANPDCGLTVLDYKFTLSEAYDGTRVGAKKGETDLIAFVNGCIEELLASGQYSVWYDEYTEYAKTLGVTNG